MISGVIETYIDDDYIATGTHKGSTGATSLYDPGADFASCGIVAGNYIENGDTGLSGNAVSVNENTVTTTSDTGGSYVTSDGTDYITTDGTPYLTTEGTGLLWNNGDTYYIYATSSKNSFKSSTVVDISKGWKTDPKDMEDGWLREDLDLDRENEQIFGPGQPDII